MPKCYRKIWLAKTMTRTLPLVSILINNYNYGKFLAQAIDSALNQTYGSVEVVVVDDGSKDNSAEIIRSYGDKIVGVIKPNGGQASAVNAGFFQCRGDIICLLDADDLCLPTRAAEVVSAFQSDGGIDWFFHRSKAFPSEVLLTQPLDSIFTQVLVENPTDPSRKIDFRQNLLNAEMPHFAPATSNINLSRRIAQQIFPMPEVPGDSGIAISDLYIKLLAVGLGTGLQVERNLCVFRLHNNLYSSTETANKRRVSTEILVATGFWIRANHPNFFRLANKLMAKGIGLYRKGDQKNLEFKHLIQEYLEKSSFLCEIKVILMSYYYSLKLAFFDLV